MIQSTQGLLGDGPIRVGIAGLGRSGWNIHAKCLSGQSPRYEVVAVADPDDLRRAEAERELGARAYVDFEKLIDDSDIDVVVVASPNRLHAEQACAAMEAGKHVVCEKPMGLSRQEADRMIQTSRKTGRVLAPFQNRRYEPHFLKVKEIIDSGLLGEVVNIRITWSFFTRRWDWQTLRSCGGGSLNNHGAHLIDHALQLFGESEPEIFADLQRTLTIGDADDHVKIILHGKDAPTIDIESFSSCAYPADRWHVTGTRGGLTGTTEQLRWKWVDWSGLPEREPDAGLVRDRKYQKEEYDWQEETWQTPANAESPYVLFYRDLEQTLRHGQHLYITPESVAREISVLEKCHAMCDAALDAKPVVIQSVPQPTAKL